MEKLKTILLSLGFSDTEASIYFILLNNGPSTISQLSSYLGAPRTTTHENTFKLIEKGLATRVQEHKGKILITPHPMTEIEHILNARREKLEEEQSQLEVLEKKASELVRSCYEINSSTFNSGAVERCLGIDETRRIYREALSSNEIHGCVNTPKLLDCFPDNLNMFLDAHQSNKDQINWEITLYSDPREADFWSEVDSKRYFHKRVPQSLGIKLPLDYLIFNSKVAIITLKEEPSCLLINSQDFYDHSLTTFNFLWGLFK